MAGPTQMQPVVDIESDAASTTFTTTAGRQNQPVTDQPAERMVGIARQRCGDEQVPRVR